MCICVLFALSRHTIHLAFRKADAALVYVAEVMLALLLLHIRLTRVAVTGSSNVLATCRMIIAYSCGSE